MLHLRNINYVKIIGVTYYLNKLTLKRLFTQNNKKSYFRRKVLSTKNAFDKLSVYIVFVS